MIAFHGTRNLPAVLKEGLKPKSHIGGCEHICLADQPHLPVAMFGDMVTVLLVDVSGLDIVWEHGEGRTHSPIPVSRIEVMDPQPEIGLWSGWEDPALRLNHIACKEKHERRPN